MTKHPDRLRSGGLVNFHVFDEIFQTGPPAGESFDGICERSVYRMYPIRSEDVDRSSERRRRRGYKDRETPVAKLLNNECRYQSFLNLGQCRFPHLFLNPGDLFRQATEEGVARES